MADLPRALQPWAELLDIFPLESAVALGPLVQRLASAVGPLRVTLPNPNGEPDGYDGLTRRGLYDRLLVSEWALAESAPEEFIRRAASYEHLFLNLRRVEPAGAKRSVAVFDAGPNQLGTPRLAHLAALIVLARRAELARVPFFWGILNCPDEPLVNGVTEANVRRLLDARTALEATAEVCAKWRDQFGTIKLDDDAWFIGGPRLARFSELDAFSRIALSEPGDVETRAVSIVVKERGRGEKQFSLPLPEDRDCVRLIRNPFEGATKKPVPQDIKPLRKRYLPVSNLVFGIGNTKLYGRNGDGELLAFPIPNSPNDKQGKPKVYRFEPGLTIHAATRLAGRTVTVDAAPDGIRLRFNPPLKNESEESLFTTTDKPLLATKAGDRMSGIFFPSASPWNFIDCFILDLAGILYRLKGGDTGRTATFITGNVKAVGVHRERLNYACLTGGGWRVVSQGKTDSDATTRKAAGGGPLAFFGFSGGAGDPDVGLLALQRDEREWLVINRVGERVFTTQPGCAVKGVITAGPNDWSKADAALVVLGNDPRQLSLVGSDWNFNLPPAPDRVVSVTCSQTAPIVAYQTESGTIVVHSLFENATLAKFSVASGQ